MDKQGIEKAIEYFKNLLLTESGEDGYSKFYYYDLAISALQQQLNGGWIPCKDRLPKTGNTIVLTQDKYGHIALAIYKDEKFYYLNQTNTTFIKGSVINGAIAWMPLPEPYREEDNDAERN